MVALAAARPAGARRRPPAATGPRRLVLVGLAVHRTARSTPQRPVPLSRAPGHRDPARGAGGVPWASPRGSAPLDAAARGAGSRRPERSRPRQLVIAAGVGYETGTFRDSSGQGVAPYWLDPGERAALAYLDHDRTPGGVFARYYLGMAVPAVHRPAHVDGGVDLDPGLRPPPGPAAEQLFAGRLTGAGPGPCVRRLDRGAVRRCTDCGARTDLSRHPRPLVVGPAPVRVCGRVRAQPGAAASRAQLAGRAPAWNAASVKRAAVARPPLDERRPQRRRRQARDRRGREASGVLGRRTAGSCAARARYSDGPPPARLASTGRPTAIASSGTSPHGSSQRHREHQRVGGRVGVAQSAGWAAREADPLADAELRGQRPSSSR